jgi:DNA-binding NarL/FixJ family response regulator
MAKLRVFLADDHAVVREGLKAMIVAQKDMEIVGEADDGPETLQKCKDLSPDIIVLDVSMPSLNGAKVTELLKLANPKVKVLALTVHDDKGYLKQLLAAGASGYVLKRAAGQELIHAIRTVAAGGIYLDPSLASKVLSTLVGKQSISQAFAGSDLSERESDVLRLIARGFTNKEIASQLGISVKTVETYKTRSMEKLGLKSRADIVRCALQQGWLQTS